MAYIRSYIRRSAATSREKPTAWQCEHHYPIEVVSMGGGRCARCLGCGASGPVREGSEQALRALRAEARYRDELGA